MKGWKLLLRSVTYNNCYNYLTKAFSKKYLKATVLIQEFSTKILSKIKAKEYKNDLMTICIKKLPTIESNIIKASNYGIACMTGSGSSIVLYDYKKKFELIHEMKKNNKIIFTQTR